MISTMKSKAAFKCSTQCLLAPSNVICNGVISLVIVHRIFMTLVTLYDCLIHVVLAYVVTDTV